VLLHTLRIIEFLNRSSHQRGPLAVKIDQILCRWLALRVVGAQQVFWCAAIKHMPELPCDIETILHGNIHSLTRLRGVGMASIAGEEHPRYLIVIVERIH